MDITQLPLISYFFDWSFVKGVNFFGFLGVIICLGACTVSWYQISKDRDARAGHPY